MFWSKKQSAKSDSLPWEPAATQALEQAIGQAPVPAMLKNQVKKQLKKAAVNTALSNNHTTVTAEDLMQGLLANMPTEMRSKIEDAMKQGPKGLQNLAEEFDNKK